MAVNKRLLQGAAGAGEFVPSEHFGVVLYEGDGASSHSINGGKFGAGVYGNQSTSRVTTNYTQANGVELTWSFWVFSGATAGIDTIIGAGTQFIMALEANKLYPMINGSNRGAGTSITADTWHHFAITYNGSGTTQVYKDGSLDVTVTGQTPTSMGTIKLFDSDETGWGVLEGKIDQVRIFQKVLSSSEVSTLYAETAATVESLDPLSEDTTDTLQVLGDTSCVATYRFENNEDDLSGNYNGTGTAIQYAAGRYGQAASFNGSSAYIDLGSNMNLSGNSFSFSFWYANTETTSGGDVNTYVIGDLDTTDQTNKRLHIGRRSFNQKLTFAFNGNDMYSATNVSTDGTWQFWTCTFNASNQARKIYLNGVLDQSQTASANYTGTANITIGKAAHSNSYAKGRIDQVRVFNKEISAAEVTTLYQENSLVASYRFEGNANDDMRNYNGTDTNVTYEYGLGFTPDFVWIKERTKIENHRWFDTTRGATKFLGSNNTNAEATGAATLTSFDTGGFTLGLDNEVNDTGIPYVAWCLKANGGTTSSNTDGTITSTVQANQDAGFSIVKYTGNATDNATVGHGLSQTPELYILKNLDQAGYKWPTHTQDVGSLSGNQTGALNETATFSSYSKSATSTVLTFSTGPDRNPNGQDMIAYCFHSVDGFSKIGTYTGTGTTGNAQVCGFEPAFLLSKRISSTSDWYIIDNKRNTTNPRNNFINANTSDAEYNPSYGVNFNSNGFSFISTDLNGTGQEWIYMAFAADPDTEAPTVAKSFSTVTYTGNGGTNSITGLGFSPGLIWLKDRDTTYPHYMYDVVRGPLHGIRPSEIDAESTTIGVSSFDSDGFTLDSNAGANQAGSPNIAWAWKADDNEPTINTEGSIDSLVSANANAGFSIVKWTTNGSGSQTVGHGLSSTPEIIFFKRLDGSQDWFVETNAIDGGYDYGNLNTTSAFQDGGSAWSTRATSTTITAFTSQNNYDYIAYCFHSVSGYSKIGSYTGIASGNVTVTTGFQPDFVMVKCVSHGSTHWEIHDSIRVFGSTGAYRLRANDSSADAGFNDTPIKYTSTGFYLDSSVTANSYVDYDANGRTYIYMAFKIN